MNFDKDLFINYWHLICHKNELLNDGDFLRFDTPIGDVVLFNDLGSIIAFDNKCPHRGAKFFKEDFGNSIISCPYHRWAYRNSKVIIPDRNRFIDCNVDDADLNKYKVEWCGDFIFLGIEPRFELKEQLGDFVLDTLQSISGNIDRRFDFNRFDFECYWAIAMENGLELYHVPSVHSTTLWNAKLTEADVFLGENYSVLNAPIGNIKMKKQLLSLKKFFDLNFQYEGFMAIYIFPFTALTSTFGYSYGLQHYFPSAEQPNITKFTSRILSSKPSKYEYTEFLKPLLEQYALSARKVFEEDNGICKQIAMNSWSTSPLKYASSMEKQIVHFRKMCSENNNSISAN
jgi:phenylpropionate dioxygenase-like ring-hydroxylating dioxygenase large terminal subunit